MVLRHASLYLLLVLTGCGASAPAMADPDRAKEVLQKALEAWKKGESYGSLQSASPPIHVSDSEWHSGRKLVNYTLGEERPAGFGWRCGVMLTVRTDEGKTRTHPAMYRVDTEPALVVVHEE